MHIPGRLNVNYEDIDSSRTCYLDVLFKVGATQLYYIHYCNHNCLIFNHMIHCSICIEKGKYCTILWASGNYCGLVDLTTHQPLVILFKTNCTSHFLYGTLNSYLYIHWILDFKWIYYYYYTFLNLHDSFVSVCK